VQIYNVYTILQVIYYLIFITSSSRKFDDYEPFNKTLYPIKFSFVFTLL
jgi:hypothetical protein